MRGGKQFTMTGHLGEVMQESMTAALSWVRANADRYDIDPDFFRKQDIHIHVPSGAVPKDGPSAGVAMVTSLVSLLTNRPLRPRVAMTGEISLTGVVLPIGGVKEKVLGARRAGIKEVILPADNEVNVKEDLQADVLEGMKIQFVRTLDEVLDLALEKEPLPSPQAGATAPPAGSASADGSCPASLRVEFSGPKDGAIFSPGSVLVVFRDTFICARYLPVLASGPKFAYICLSGIKRDPFLCHLQKKRTDPARARSLLRASWRTASLWRFVPKV